MFAWLFFYFSQQCNQEFNDREGHDVRISVYRTGINDETNHFKTCEHRLYRNQCGTGDNQQHGTADNK